MKVSGLLGGNPMGHPDVEAGARVPADTSGSPLVGAYRGGRQHSSIVFPNAIVAQALGELIHHVLLEKIQKLGPATLLFRHGSSRVIRFCFSGWIDAFRHNTWPVVGPVRPGRNPGQSRGREAGLGPEPDLQPRGLRERYWCSALTLLPTPGAPPPQQDGETRHISAVLKRIGL